MCFLTGPRLRLDAGERGTTVPVSKAPPNGPRAQVPGRVRGWMMRARMVATVAASAAVALLAPLGVFAQAPSPSASSNQGPSSPPPSTQAPPLITPAQIDQLVAPIALYPDPVLSQILMAASYPVEV